jgi:5-(carboxyamino)imidazole ribonucleotide mutase
VTARRRSGRRRRGPRLGSRPPVAPAVRCPVSSISRGHSPRPTRATHAESESRDPAGGGGHGQPVGLGDAEAGGGGPDRPGDPHEAKVVSAHRTPDRLFRYGQTAEARGLEVLIAGAGGAAHLPGMLAALTILPVLGVPVESKALRGVDSLLSIVQMPKGSRSGPWPSPRRATNAALLAAAILARSVPRDPRGALARPGRADRRVAESPNERAVARAWPPGPSASGRRRPARPDVRPGRAAMGYRARVPQRPRGPRRRSPTGRRRPPDSPPRGFAERPEAVPSSSRTSRPPALRGSPARPSGRLADRPVSQDRLREKSFLAARLPVPLAPVRSGPELGRRRRGAGLPLILTRRPPRASTARGQVRPR